MSNENTLAYAVKQNEIDYNAKNLVLLQAQLINKNENGHVMVEKVSKDADSYAAGKYYIPGVAMEFGEHPEEAGHRILTEELEISDRKINSVGSQSQNDEEKDRAKRNKISNDEQLWRDAGALSSKEVSATVSWTSTTDSLLSLIIVYN